MIMIMIITNYQIPSMPQKSPLLFQHPKLFAGKSQAVLRSQSGMRRHVEFSTYSDFAEGRFTLQNCVRDFASNKRISGDFQIKQYDFHKRCTRFF